MPVESRLRVAAPYCRVDRGKLKQLFLADTPQLEIVSGEGARRFSAPTFHLGNSVVSGPIRTWERSTDSHTVCHSRPRLFSPDTSLDPVSKKRSPRLEAAATATLNVFEGDAVRHDATGSTLTLADGRTVRCKLVVDATGAESKLTVRAVCEPEPLSLSLSLSTLERCGP